MHILIPRGPMSARSAILTFGSVAGSIWLISLLAALVTKSGPAARVLMSELAGATSVLMLAFVLPVMVCAWQGWWRGVAVVLTGGALMVAGLIVFATV